MHFNHHFSTDRMLAWKENIKKRFPHGFLKANRTKEMGQNQVGQEQKKKSVLRANGCESEYAFVRDTQR